MKIALIEPSNLSHRVRGTGFYLENLLRSFKKYFPNDEITLSAKTTRNADIIHYPFFEPFFLSLPLLKNKKTVVTVHDLTPIKFSKYFPVGFRGSLKWQIQKLSLKNADAVITDSKNSKTDILKFAGVAEDKVHVVYLAASEEFDNPMSENKLQETTEKYNLPEEFLLYVGDVTWNKNLPSLIKAVSKTDYKLVIAGKAFVQKDFDKSNLWNQGLLEAQKLADSNKKILSIGFVEKDDLKAIYRLAKVFIMPSIYEGFGLPVLEAMASGCPVVTTQEGSLKEVAGDSALFVNPYNIDSIAEGVKEIMSNETLRKNLSEKGKKQALKFSWRKTAEETLKVYRKVLNE
ncbi:MAG: glycosyltransferase family 1 protein [Patescibacteria group bacterium]